LAAIAASWALLEPASACHSSRCQAATRKLRRIVCPKSPFGSSTTVRLRNSGSRRRNASWSSSRPWPSSAGVRQQQPRLSDQVERDVGERDVLLDHRAVAAPLRQPLAEDQRGVGQPQHILEVRGMRLRGGTHCGTYMWLTSSGSV
jgi:hypothetical protein